jgi:hypothetical protein
MAALGGAEKPRQGHHADSGQLAGQVNHDPFDAVVEVNGQTLDVLFLEQGRDIVNVGP